jgi:hypothetical protein
VVQQFSDVSEESTSSTFMAEEQAMQEAYLLAVHMA